MKVVTTNMATALQSVSCERRSKNNQPKHKFAIFQHYFLRPSEWVYDFNSV